MHPIHLAYQRLREVVHEAGTTGDWGPVADLYAPDAVLRRPGIPDCHGREEIRAFLLASTATFPGSHVARVDIGWHTIDEQRGRVVHELRHVMVDPGDGVTHHATTTAMLGLGGDGLWMTIDDTFNPHAYRMMYRSWLRAALLHGALDVPDEIIEATLVSLEESTAAHQTPGASGAS